MESSPSGEPTVGVDTVVEVAVDGSSVGVDDDVVDESGATSCMEPVSEHPMTPKIKTEQAIREYRRIR